MVFWIVSAALVLFALIVIRICIGRTGKPRPTRGEHWQHERSAEERYAKQHGTKHPDEDQGWH